ncbi:hypothetical protein NDU88_003127 [Pleurodeles waltl]|uniref:Uncharacterized protein n=1 Tax=Pleurodeles waltl TaxID=8319 RepID=A0AAV7PG27_PLEWA|nr:hypothetical protein NDU88_003127 [Pleurodeles waltl]
MVNAALRGFSATSVASDDRCYELAVSPRSRFKLLTTARTSLFCRSEVGRERSSNHTSTPAAMLAMPPS